MNVWEFLNSGNNLSWVAVIVFFVMMGLVQIVRAWKGRSDD